MAPSGTTTYAFDADGNQELVVAPDGTRTTTTWDYENKPTLTQLSAGIRNTFTYNADGLRTEKQDSEGITRFLWDSRQYLAETDGIGQTIALYTNAPGVYTELISQQWDGATQFPHYDTLGSTRQLTDADEAVTDTFLYDAWGIRSSAPAPRRFPSAGSVSSVITSTRTATPFTSLPGPIIPARKKLTATRRLISGRRGRRDA